MAQRKRLRAMDMITNDGVKEVMPRSWDEASAIGRHHAAALAYLADEPHAAARLADYDGAWAGGHEFETDPDVIELLGIEGEIDPWDIYPDERGDA